MTSIGRQSFGQPGLPLPQVYVQATLALIVQAGINLQKRKAVTSRLKENEITYLVEDEMKAVQANGISDMLIFNVRVDMPFNLTTPLDRCEPDIKFQWFEYPVNHKRYLAVEAKKLYGKGRTRADAYVEGGVIDFVTGKYSSGHDYAIMLGYIVIGPVPKAIAAVKDAMDSRKTVTNERSPFLPDNSISTHPNTHHSSHLPTSGAPPITLIHIFLDLC